MDHCLGGSPAQSVILMLIVIALTVLQFRLYRIRATATGHNHPYPSTPCAPCLSSRLGFFSLRAYRAG
jgi:hypothetical protein